MSKSDFAQQTQGLAHNTAILSNHLADITDMYFDRGYNSGGKDPIADADLESFGFTAADLGSFITLSQEFVKLLNNQATITGDYDSALSKIRKAVDITRRPY